MAEGYELKLVPDLDLRVGAVLEELQLNKKRELAPDFWKLALCTSLDPVKRPRPLHHSSGLIYLAYRVFILSISPFHLVRTFIETFFSLFIWTH